MSKRVALNLKTPPFVLSYPAIWTPRENGKFVTGKKKYGCSAIWVPSKFGDLDRKLWAAMDAEIVAAICDKFKIQGVTSRAQAEAALNDKYDTAKMGIRSPDAERRKKKGYDAPGTVFASLTSTSIPGVVDRGGHPISPESGNEEEIYPGAICRASIQVYAYDQSGGRGYALGLGNLQKLANGPRLDSRVAATIDFADAELDPAFIEMMDAEAGDAEEANFG
jgi:ssDNA-binding protein